MNPYDHAHSADLELAVLAPLLDGRHPHLQSIFAETCPTADYFWETKHQWLARVILAMISRGDRIDAQTVIVATQRIRYQDFMERGKPLHLADGIAPSHALSAGLTAEEIFAVLQATSFVSGYQKNCEHLAEFYTQRQLIALLAEEMDQATAAGGSVRLGQIGDRLITRTAGLLTAQEGSATLSDAMRKAMDRHRASAMHGEARVASWGMPGLDRVIPLRGGRFIVLAAQPNHGKTSLALQAAMASAELLGKGAVGMVSLETAPEELGAILLAREIKTTARAIEGGQMSADQTHQAGEIIARWDEADVYLRSSHGKCTIDDIAAWIRQRHVRSAGRLSLVVVDYLQLLDAKGRDRDIEKLSDATRALKRLALDLRICLLVLSQMSREGTKPDRDSHGRAKGNPEPRLQDLRGSGTIEQDADGVVFIWPPMETTVDVLPVHLKVAKNRQGPKLTIDAAFERAQGQVFREMSSTRVHHAHPPRADEDRLAPVDHDPQQEEPA